MSTRRILLLIAILAALLLVAVAYMAVRPREASPAIQLRLESFALNLDPRKMSDAESRRVATLLHVGLIRVDQDGSVKPGIATEWKHLGATTEFKLQTGLTFSDGSPITATAVQASLCESMQPSALFAWTLASINHEKSIDGKSVRCTGITSDDRINTIVVVESTPKPWLLEALAGPGGWVVKPGAKPGEYGDVPGAGPFRVASVTPDSRVVLESRDGGPINARAGRVVMQHIADDAQAAALFRAGKLDVVEIGNPTLARLVGVNQNGTKTAGSETDRVRVLIFGRKSLAAKGYNDDHVRSLMRAIAVQFDRKRVTGTSPLLAVEIGVPFPFGTIVPEFPESQSTDSLPAGQLNVITESDQYSDFIAAQIPKRVGAVSLDYKGVDKGLLVDRIIKGDFDIASVAIEGTVRAPEFWISFFQPGSPFTVFGEPLRALQGIPLTTDAERTSALTVVATHGNWLGLIRERRIVATSPTLTGLRFTPTGQVSYEGIGRQ